jgi:surfeit locus 1 family protein
MMISKVSKFFKPSMVATVSLFLLATLFANLGMWQTRRGEEKVATEQQFAAAKPLLLENAIARESRFAQIDVSGHYDNERHILLDNQVWNGRAGVHVFTPFHTITGTVILVNRGWLPLAADRQSMPQTPTPKNQTVLRGMLNIFPVPGRMLGPADKLTSTNWPQLVTYLNHADVEIALGTALANWIVQLSATEQAGFDGRDWQPVFLTSNKHKAYAFQWYALTGISMVLWIFNGIRRSRENIKGNTHSE